MDVLVAPRDSWSWTWVPVLPEQSCSVGDSLGWGSCLGCLGEKAAGQGTFWFITAQEISCQMSCQSAISLMAFCLLLCSTASAIWSLRCWNVSTSAIYFWPRNSFLRAGKIFFTCSLICSRYLKLICIWYLKTSDIENKGSSFFWAIPNAKKHSNNPLCRKAQTRAGGSTVVADNLVYVGSKQGCVLNLSSSYSLDFCSMLMACAGDWKPLSFGTQTQMCAPSLGGLSDLPPKA